MKLTRVVVHITLLLAAFGLGWHLGTSQTSKVHAQNMKSATIPKAWGAVKATGLNGTYYVLEAPDGTIRVVAMEGGGVVATASRN
ncbi:MAG: hypothetical protein ACLQKA_04205 [Bryobacteraceae bacterium]